MKVCYVCNRELPLDAFLTITVRDKRCKPGHSWTGPSSDCRECRKSERREARRRKAEEAGRLFVPRGDPAAYQAQQRAAREARRAERRIAWAMCIAFWALVSQSPDERRRRNIARITRRQRERRNTDPVYWATIKARKIIRSRAQQGTQVEPVSLERVAERDSWKCGICGGIVTRSDWSLDHIVPLSKGGAHTYGNVQLAHRVCNSAKGDRAASSVPLTHEDTRD